MVPPNVQTQMRSSSVVTVRPPLLQQGFRKWSSFGFLLEKFQPGFSSLIEDSQIQLAFSSINYVFI
ncbi:hypothetical protein DQ195_09175 [Enterococcus faecium]|nr:hypothetical protein [Enterococcus faecium]EGP5690754.1 hypothetical protein [Enterococcus faecium]EGP5733493.1 hypothetical protein [Enterococcus faecium]